LTVRAAALAALVVFCSACSPEPEDPAFSDELPPESELGRVHDAIEAERKRLRGLEGREGILAEERRYSLFDEELVIRDFFEDRREGFFLDVGCAWPVRSNNTYYLEKHLDWKGIGIDALAEYGPGWKRKRPHSRFFAYLVTDHSGSMQTFFKSPNPGLSSTDRELASGNVFGDVFEPEEVRVETISLDDLLDREGVAKIDLLSLDIEGHEPKALAGFDIERFRPDLVVIERQLAAENRGVGAVGRYFAQHGYRQIDRYRRFDRTNLYFEPADD
jgi:FkbM family methyltransferase